MDFKTERTKMLRGWLKRQKSLVTYGQVMKLFYNELDRFTLCKMLGDICKMDANKGLPPQSAKVVYKADYRPGAGFYNCCKDLGLIQEGESELLYWQKVITEFGIVL